MNITAAEADARYRRVQLRTRFRAYRIVCAVVAAVLFMARATDARAQVRNFRSYTATEGMPQAQVMAIQQDRKGYIWFGTYGGLTRFNGSEFRTLTTDDGLTANGVFDLATDADGRLLIATSGGICYLDDGSFTCYRQSDGLINDNVRSVVSDLAGGAWIGTSRGVSHVTADGQIKNYAAAEGLPEGHVLRVAVDSARRVWVASDSGLSRLEGDRFVADSPEVFSGRSVNFISLAGRGLLVGSEGRLFFRRDDGVLPIDVELPPDVSFRDGAIDRDGTIWLATDAGALSVANGRVEHMTRQNGLLSNMLTRIALDREGDVWFGTENGASKHVPGPFMTYTVLEGLPSPFVRALEVDGNGSLWVGTRAGVVVLEDGKFRGIDVSAMPSSRVYALGRSPEGGMLIGGRPGLGYYRDGRLKVYTADDGLPGNVVYSLLQDGHGGVFIGTDRGLARWHDGTVEAIDQPGVEALSIISLASDDRGRLWMGQLAGGVKIWDADSLISLGPEQGLSDQTIWSMAMDARGRMWVGTNGNGAFRVSHDRIERFTTEEGLTNNFIWQVMPDSRGNIWLFSNKGLDRLSGDRLVHYGRGSGLIELEGSANAVHEDAKGDVWFGTGEGLVHYSPGLDEPPAVRPTVSVERVTHDGDPIVEAGARLIAGTGPARLEHGAMRFFFASPSFRDESAIRYRYRLVGADDGWSQPVEERSIAYAGLAPGAYRFEVVAENGVLESEAPGTFAFVITPAFWETLWFRIPAALLLVAAIVAVPIVRAGRLERETHRLEALVARHTRDLAEKNDRLEQSNRDLEHFAYVASHDLQEPLRKIRAFSDRVSRLYTDRLDEQGRDYLARTENAAARMQQLIDDLLALSRVTTRPNPIRPIDLGVLIREVLADLEIRIQQTGGRVELGDLPTIAADPLQIRQLMQNLIGNALKFHRPDEPPVVRVTAEPAGDDRIEIRVEDNGIGFDPVEADKLFKPFHRLHTRMQYEGTGIGLSICQKIVERHGGSIRAASTPDAGSRFIVTLPVHQSLETAHAA